MVLDEAQRIKNRESKTAQVVRRIRRDAELGADRHADREPPGRPGQHLRVRRPGPHPAGHAAASRCRRCTADCILRRTKDDGAVGHAAEDRSSDLDLELTPAQREAYDLAENEGVVHLNELGDTITVQHVFELVMRLKQICNFDPLTGESAKLEQLLADMEEVADSGRKAIVFSQWVEPLEVLAKALAAVRPAAVPRQDPADRAARRSSTASRPTRTATCC